MSDQFSNRESLRFLIVYLDVRYYKCYHLGMSKNVSRSDLARTSQNRDYHIFEEYAYYLGNEERKNRITDIFKLSRNFYALIQHPLIYASLYSGRDVSQEERRFKKQTLYDVNNNQLRFLCHRNFHARSKKMNEILYVYCS